MFLNRDDSDGSRIALRDAYGDYYTYDELDKLTKEYSELIMPRSLVLIFCDYEIETVAFYYAMLASRNVPILVDGKLDFELQERILKVYCPNYIWKCSALENDVILRRKGHMLIKKNEKPIHMYKNLALLLTTSGSTGSPKMVRLSYDNLYSNAKSLAAYVELQIDDVAITTLPFYYCYGLSVMHMHWYMGACVCVTEQSMVHGMFWDFFEKYKVTNFATVPYQYEILEKIGFLEWELPVFRFVTQAGGKLSEKYQCNFGRKLSQNGKRLFVMYGQTEGTCILSGIPHNRVVGKPGSIGLPLEGVTAEIYKPNREGVGELVLGGGSVSLGYAVSKEDLQIKDSNGGVLYTGDLAFVDSEGYIYLKGRKRRFVKMLGVRVSLDEMEEILQEYYPKIEITCVGTDNQITIYYVGLADDKELKKFCRKKFSIAHQMVEVRQLKKLPRNSYGKVQYAELP